MMYARLEIHTYVRMYIHAYINSKYQQTEHYISLEGNKFVALSRRRSLIMYKGIYLCHHILHTGDVCFRNSVRETEKDTLTEPFFPRNLIYSTRRRYVIVKSRHCWLEIGYVIFWWHFTKRTSQNSVRHKQKISTSSFWNLLKFWIKSSLTGKLSAELVFGM